MISIEGNVRGLKLSNNSETCPFCGGRAYLAEGVFDIADNVISVLSAQDITIDMFKILGAAVVEAYKDQSKSDELIRIAEGIDPRLAVVIKNIATNKNFMLVGLFLLALAIKSCSINVSLNANELIDQLNSDPPQKTSIESIFV
jgi:hypothetical protein